MAKLPLIIIPEEDELLYSYIRRLSVSMEEPDYDTFFRRYIRPFDDGKRNTRSSVRYDSNHDMSYILLQISETLGMKLSDLFLKMSIYPAFAPLLTDFQQEGWINQISREGSTSFGLTTRVHADMITELKICPQCCQESQRLIYYRKHQLPGVKVCPVHGCVLQRYIGKKGQEFKNPQFEEVTDGVEITDIDYARFAASFLEGKIQCTNAEITALIKEKFRKMGFKRFDNKALIHYASMTNRESYATEEILLYADTIYKRSGTFNRRQNPENLLKMLFLLFSDVDEICSSLPETSSSKETFIDYTGERGYRLVSEFNNLAVTMRHASCGYEFITTPSMFMHGWECPQCDLEFSEEEIYNRVFSRIYNGDYEKQNRYIGPNVRMSVKHLSCGRIVNRRAISFIQEKTKCSCGKDVNTNEHAEALLKDYPEWDLIHFSSMKEEVTLLHRPCGTKKIFYNMYNFLRLPNCPVCDPLATTENAFLASLEALVGDKITLVGKYTSSHVKTVFRCNTCGKEFLSEPIHLLRGKRCPECSSSIRFSYEEMCEYVNGYTNGRYIVVGQPYSGRFIIRNSITEEEIELTRQMILQELTRPTPSKILPLPNEASDVKKTIEETTAIISEWINVYLQNHECFYYHELKNSLMNSQYKMTEKEFLLGWVEYLPLQKIRCVQQSWRLYTLSDRKINAQRFLQERFIIDSEGNRIGYYSGAHFLVDIGVDIDLSERPQIITNEPPGGKDTTITIDGTRYCINHGRHGIITNENYAYQEVLSWIQSKYYSKDPDITRHIIEYIISCRLTEEGFEKELRTYSKGAIFRIHDLISRID